VSDPSSIDERRDEEASAAQRSGTRRLSLEDRFRQNDSLSRFRIEALRSRTGVGPYEAHMSGAEDRAVFGVRIRVAGLGDLIASKEATGRPKDEAILKDLRELRDTRPG
jgi:hypothetical protein